jgi:serine/threonine-protein kinase
VPTELDRLKAALADLYAIEEEVGSGGMATVYLAEDVKHRRKVAVKVLRSDLAAALGSERFLREIEIAAQLHHPHILPLYDSGEADGFLYYVMPYESGQSLRDRLQREGELPVNEAVRILRDVADALAHAHGLGVVHRDIKPENIMLSGRHALVTDFGVAKAVSEATGRQQLTTAGVALGTPTYMAPEQAAADPNIDHRADVYALGVMAYELLAGRPPFAGPTAQAVLAAHITEAPEPITTHRTTVPAPFAELVMRSLEKKAADRWQTAEELLAQLEALATPSGGITPTDTRPVKAPAMPDGKRGMLFGGAAAAIVVAALGFFVLRPSSAPEIDPNVVAVAPFDVLDPELEMWHEGLADILSRSLDGAGPLRTVPPSMVIKQWGGRADAASALDLGRSLGAGFVVYGLLVGAGEDSVRLTATVFDVEANAASAEFEVRDVEDRIDRLADSLTIRLVSDLTRRGDLGDWRPASVGSSSPAAVKAFLQGEREFRRFNLDSARTHYEQAIALDSSFALAYSRLGDVAGWATLADESNQMGLRAGALNHGLALRDSLILVSDSLWAANATSFNGDSASWARHRRMFSTLDYAVRRYPRDPQIWMRLGEARYHWGFMIDIPDEDAFASFKRAVELDSAYAPGYQHLVELTLTFEGLEAAQRVIDAYARSTADTEEGAALQVVRDLLDPDLADSPEVQARLEGLDTEGLFDAAYATRKWIDSADSKLRILRVFAATGDQRGVIQLARGLAHRGRIEEAAEVIAPPAWVVAEHARIGFLPESRARAFADSVALSGDGFLTYQTLPWWLLAGDTTTLGRIIVRFDSLAEADPANSAGPRIVSAIARAYTAVIGGDTTAALEQLSELPIWPCGVCYTERLTRARLLAATGRDREAAEVLEEFPIMTAAWPRPEWVVWTMERARVNDRLGNSEEAIEDYAHVVDVWRDADPYFQPVVQEAREALARLTGEPRR